MAPIVLSMPRGMWGPFCHTGVQRRLQYCRHKCRRLHYYLCQGDCGALFPQAYRVWSLVSWFDLCDAFSVHPWSLPSGRPWSDGPSLLWLCRSKKSVVSRHDDCGVPLSVLEMCVDTKISSHAEDTRSKPEGSARWSWRSA